MIPIMLPSPPPLHLHHNALHKPVMVASPPTNHSIHEDLHPPPPQHHHHQVMSTVILTCMIIFRDQPLETHLPMERMVLDVVVCLAYPPPLHHHHNIRLHILPQPVTIYVHLLWEYLGLDFGCLVAYHPRDILRSLLLLVVVVG